MQQPPNRYPQYPEQQWQQQPNYTQPQSYFPPPPTLSQQQQSKPQQLDKPPTSRTSRSRTWLWVLIALIVGMVIGYAIHVPGAQSTSNDTTTTTQNISQATSQPTQASTHVSITPTPTHTPKWTTVQTFTGNGSKKTAIFTVPDDWKIVWSCNPSSFGGSYNVQLDVVSADGSPFDPGAINTICQAGNVSGETEEHQSGQVYFDINSEAAWTIQVQELK